MLTRVVLAWCYDHLDYVLLWLYTIIYGPMPRHLRLGLVTNLHVLVNICNLGEPQVCRCLHHFLRQIDVRTATFAFPGPLTPGRFRLAPATPSVRP
jgi:hypothetical protein